jgi:hypothetical protein
MKDKTGKPFWNAGETVHDPEQRGLNIPIESITSIQISEISGFLDNTAGGTDAETTKAPTSNVMFDHAAAATGVHGAGTSTLATTANITTHANLTATHGAGTIAAVADITNHTALTTGIHGLGTMSGAATADYMKYVVFTAKGDLLAGSANAAPTVLTIAGTGGYVLTADSAEVTGMKWASVSAATGGVAMTDYTAKGDILAGSAASSPDALHIAGTSGYVLTADSAEVTGMKWAAAAGGGDMLRTTYDPNTDGVIVAAQLDTTILYKTAYSAKGMILAGSAANAPSGLAIAGTTGYYLIADSAEVTGLKWSAPSAGGDLKSDGTVPLAANWDVGAFKITAAQIASDIASGTAPLIVTSTTLVSNLNVDKLDNLEATAFVAVASTTLSGAGFLVDEDNMVSDSAVKVPSQQSVKAYVTASPLNSTITMTPASIADHGYAGVSVNAIAGTNLTVGQICYQGSDGKMELADADQATTMPALYMSTGTINENATGVFLLHGYLRDDTWTWTIGGLLYVDTVTSGGMTHTAPSGVGDQAQIAGQAYSADIVYWNPCPILVEVKA